jgi:hypothetical protein
MPSDTLKNDILDYVDTGSCIAVLLRDFRRDFGVDAVEIAEVDIFQAILEMIEDKQLKLQSRILFWGPEWKTVREMSSS